MYMKMEITGEIEVLTGMHIGGSAQFSAIGAIDSPVVRDVESDLPMIPGSSLKGKLRTLLARKYCEGLPQEPNKDPVEILRLFGSSEKNNMRRSRLLFADMVLQNMEDLRQIGIYSATEIKSENKIDRLTARADPRQIERTIRGSRFALSIIYDADESEEIVEDIALLAEGLRLLQYDYLGGHGSRGYGKVAFHNLAIRPVIGEIAPEILEQCADSLKEV